MIPLRWTSNKYSKKKLFTKRKLVCIDTVDLPVGQNLFMERPNRSTSVLRHLKWTSKITMLSLEISWHFISTFLLELSSPPTISIMNSSVRFRTLQLTYCRNILEKTTFSVRNKTTVTLANEKPHKFDIRTHFPVSSAYVSYDRRE